MVGQPNGRWRAQGSEAGNTGSGGGWLGQAEMGAMTAIAVEGVVGGEAAGTGESRWSPTPVAVCAGLQCDPFAPAAWEVVCEDKVLTRGTRCSRKKTNKCLFVG